jgi:hypothetical protein
MPIQIESVINEISPQSGGGSDASAADNRWQKAQELAAIIDQQQYQAMRVQAEDFND